VPWVVVAQLELSFENAAGSTVSSRMECTQNWMATNKTVLRASLFTMLAPKHSMRVKKLNICYKDFTAHFTVL
jgi:hypothetical protein